MIITVTLNPAMDKTMYVNDLMINQVNRATKTRNDVGGKGINVSKVLRNFGIESICTGFIGGPYSEVFQNKLEKWEIGHAFTMIQDEMRINIKVVDETNQSHTDINEIGPYVSIEETECFVKHFSQICGENDIIVLAGKSPRGKALVGIYERLISIAASKGANVILDIETDGQLLEKVTPYGMKPNLKELEQLAGEKILSKHDFISSANAIMEKGVSQLLVSLGEKGCVLVTEKDFLYVEGFKVQVQSTVGAGDSMVAALTYSLLHGKNSRETLALANSFGTASVMKEGTEACTPEDVKLFYQASLDKIKQGIPDIF